ncbi:hypothetical protein [Roseateles violae]
MRATLLLTALIVLSACGEKPQTAASGRKTDDKPWGETSSGYAAAGFKSGDQAAWEQQIRARNQAQNEYNRTGSH